MHLKYVYSHDASESILGVKKDKFIRKITENEVKYLNYIKPLKRMVYFQLLLGKIPNMNLPQPWKH